MNLIYTFLTLAALAFGGYGFFLVAKTNDRSKAQVRARYEACIEQGKDSMTCGHDEIVLRGLSACG